MIAVVIPTIRQESYSKFLEAWESLFKKHQVQLVTIFDGERPRVKCMSYSGEHISNTFHNDVQSIMGKDADLIYNYNAGVRNLGFAYVAKFLPTVKYILSLDDDVEPVGDTIQDHIDILDKSVPVSWMNTTMTDFMRGFPYNIRHEADVWFSHGLWTNIADFDAPYQLLNGITPQDFYRGPIPKGILYPCCSMNIAFRKEALPYVYMAPMGKQVGLDRFDDIWGGIETKKDLDRLGKAVVSGYALVKHLRASNVYTNLKKEAGGIEMNDYYGEDEYFDLFFEKRKRWNKFISKQK